MELAEKIHQCIFGMCLAHELLDYYNQVDDIDTLKTIYEYIYEKYDYSPHELLSDKLNVNELYALSSTEKFIRKPTLKNKEERDRFYLDIGYKMPAKVKKKTYKL